MPSGADAAWPSDTATSDGVSSAKGDTGAPRRGVAPVPGLSYSSEQALHVAVSQTDNLDNPENTTRGIIATSWGQSGHILRDGGLDFRQTLPAFLCPPPLWPRARTRTESFCFSAHRSSVSDLSPSVENFFFFCRFCFISLDYFFFPLSSAIINPVPHISRRAS